jgi:hypothetical protein
MSAQNASMSFEPLFLQAAFSALASGQRGGYRDDVWRAGLLEELRLEQGIPHHDSVPICFSAFWATSEGTAPHLFVNSADIIVHYFGICCAHASSHSFAVFFFFLAIARSIERG